MNSTSASFSAGASSVPYRLPSWPAFELPGLAVSYVKELSSALFREIETKPTFVES